MDIVKLTEALNSVRNGSFTRIGYATELPVKSIYKKAGVKIIKETESTVRFGVKYKNIGSVKERSVKEEKTKKTNNYTPIIENKLLYNTNTGKYYVCAFPTKKGTNSKSIYNVVVNDVVIISSAEKDIISHLVIDSYWGKDFRETFRVNAENIKRLGNFVF